MADKDFVVKNSLVVNTSVVANSTTVVANGVTINSTGGFYDGYVNATAFTGGNTAGTTGIIANTSQVFIGNTTVNAYLNTVGLNVNNATIANTIGVYTGTVNAAVHSIGTTMVANNSGIFFPTGNVVSSSVNTTFEYVNGFIHVSNTTGNVQILPGLYSINATGVVNASSYTIGGNLVANTIGVYHTGIVNASSHTTGSGYGTATGGATVNSTVIGMGNSSINGYISSNSTTSFYTGTAYVAASIPLITSNVEVRTANITINATAGIIANGSIGVAGQVLLSNGSSVYWASVNSSVITAAGSDTQIQFNDTNTLAASAGLRFNKTSNTITIGNTGTNATVNSTVYTGTANNTSYLGGTIASSYAKSADVHYIGTTSIALNRSSASQSLTGVSIDGSANSTTYIVANTGLVSNSSGVFVNAAYINTISSNSTNFVGTVSAANVVSNTQLSGNLSFYTTTSTLAASGLVYKASTLAQGGGTGAAMTFNWSGQGGQPSWLWGGNDGANHYVYNPSNFNVNSATSATTATNSSQLGGVASSSYALKADYAALSGANFTGQGLFTYGQSATLQNASGGLGGIMLQATSGGAAYQAFHRPGSYAIYFGLDTDNQMAAGGWSSGSSYTAANWKFGSIGVGTTASGTAGEIRATNNITAYYSDDRLKVRLGNIENALSKVQSLNGFHYEANETAQALGYKAMPEVGVSAQEVQAILPEIVVPAPIDDKYLTVRYEKLVPLLIEAIKELKAEVDALKNRD